MMIKLEKCTAQEALDNNALIIDFEITPFPVPHGGIGIVSLFEYEDYLIKHLESIDLEEHVPQPTHIWASPVIRMPTSENSRTVTLGFPQKYTYRVVYED